MLVNSHVLHLTLLATPAALVLFLALCWLLGAPLSERFVARLTGLVYGVLTLVVSALGWEVWKAPLHAIPTSLGSWFTVGEYGFPVELLADAISFPLVAVTVVLVGLAGSFSVRYLHRDPGFNRFFLLLNLFAFGALLIFSSSSVDLLIAGWEIVGITSVLLIAFFQYRPAPVQNGLRVFATYRIADMAILLAVFLAHHWAGTGMWKNLFHGLDASGAPLSKHQINTLAVLLVLAASGKSAQGPFSGWLPRAMEGPTPSSAVFYGALSVHAGAYLLLRAEPLLLVSPLATRILLMIGGGTALLSTLVHRTCADAKTSIAYAAQTQLGIIFCEIALGFPNLALLHICSHAIFRAMQFLRAPSMLREYHRVHAAAGGRLRPTGEHLEVLLPKPVQIFLYRVALGRGFYDAIVDRWVIAPAVGFAKALAVFEPPWIRPAASTPHRHADHAAPGPENTPPPASTAPTAHASRP